MISRKIKIDTGSELTDGLIVLSAVAFIVSLPVAWITHIVWAIGKLASDEGATIGQAVLMAVGAFMPPVGVVHGYMIWFGAGMG
jgi:hypothetical protein